MLEHFEMLNVENATRNTSSIEKLGNKFSKIARPGKSILSITNRHHNTVTSYYTQCWCVDIYTGVVQADSEHEILSTSVNTGAREKCPPKVHQVFF